MKRFVVKVNLSNGDMFYLGLYHESSIQNYTSVIHWAKRLTDIQIALHETAAYLKSVSWGSKVRTITFEQVEN